MPEEYTITGTINLPDGGGRAGLRIRAFDRDLPSLESRRGSGLQLLGEAFTNDMTNSIPSSQCRYASGMARRSGRISLIRKAPTVAKRRCKLSPCSPCTKARD
jgi:hypothetical protein